MNETLNGNRVGFCFQSQILFNKVCAGRVHVTWLFHLLQKQDEKWGKSQIRERDTVNLRWINEFVPLPWYTYCHHYSTVASHSMSVTEGRSARLWLKSTARPHQPATVALWGKFFFFFSSAAVPWVGMSLWSATGETISKDTQVIKQYTVMFLPPILLVFPLSAWPTSHNSQVMYCVDKPTHGALKHRTLFRNMCF